MGPSEKTAGRPSQLRRRLVWLLLSLAAGGLIGYVGSALTGSERWYLAMPAAVAVVWLFFANPAECQPSADPRREDDADPDGAP